MSLRIADYVLSGELRNTRRNSVFGWIEFAPDYGIRIELTGNFSGELAGKHIRFHMSREDSLSPGSFPAFIEELSDRQIGVVQTMELRQVKIPQASNDDFLKLSEAEQQVNLVEKNSLWLEWSSQDGNVVCELIAPDIEWVDEDDAEPDLSNYEPIDENFGLGITGISIGGEDATDPQSIDSAGDAEEQDESEDDQEDPYNLFDENLEENVRESLGSDLLGEFDADLDSQAPNASGEKLAWDEVIPDIDPKTKAMYEQWDEIFEGKKDQPISYLFPTPLKLPKPESVSSEEMAEGLVKAILAQLALLSVALDVCEHFTPSQTYRLLMQEILPSANVHPNLAASEMVQHYATSDYCQQCDAEFEAEYETRKSDDDESDETE